MEIWHLPLLALIGIFAGFINVVAGGGSLLTLPTLIFLGLPSNVANASNRIAIIFQNLFAAKGFKEEKISTYPYNMYISASALVGALLGAQLSVHIDDALFQKVLAVIMVFIVLYTIFKPGNKGIKATEKLDTKSKVIGTIVFFFIGIYGGFVQAGVGLVVMAALSIVNNFSLVKANSAKVIVILVFNLAAFSVFLFNDIVNWKYGLSLAVGNSIGGYIASKWQVKSGEIWIKRILLVIVSILAVKLLMS